MGGTVYLAVHSLYGNIFIRFWYSGPTPYPVGLIFRLKSNKTQTYYVGWLKWQPTDQVKYKRRSSLFDVLTKF